MASNNTRFYKYIQMHINTLKKQRNTQSEIDGVVACYAYIPLNIRYHLHLFYGLNAKTLNSIQIIWE